VWLLVWNGWKVNWSRWNLEYSKYIFGAGPGGFGCYRHSSERWGARRNFFCQANKARLYRFSVGQFSQNLNTTYGHKMWIGKMVNHFGLEFWKFSRKGSVLFSSVPLATGPAYSGPTCWGVVFPKKMQKRSGLSMSFSFLNASFQQVPVVRPFYGLLSRTTWVSRHQEGKPFWILEGVVLHLLIY